MLERALAPEQRLALVREQRRLAREQLQEQAQQRLEQAQHSHRSRALP